MSTFHVIDDAFVILRSRGVYRQAKVFLRDEQLYAGLGAGFIKLLGSGGTSVPTVSWENLTPPRKHQIVAGYLGAPVFEEASNVRRIK